jgi:1-deoxy-D-xylulose-5-phosphate synthase
MAPKDENELQHMLHTAVLHKGPAAIRYPRGQGEGVELSDKLSEIPIGKGELLREGNDILLLPVGNRVYPALEAAMGLEKVGIDAAVINPRFVKPLDSDLIIDWAVKTGKVVTVEDNACRGGFGSAVLELLASNNLSHIKVHILGYADKFMEHGTQEILWRKGHIDGPAIINAAMEMMDTPAQ